MLSHKLETLVPPLEKHIILFKLKLQNIPEPLV